MTTNTVSHAWWKRILLVFLSVLLVLTVVPLSPLMQTAHGQIIDIQPGLSDEDIAALLAAEDYVEGEVIAVVDESSLETDSVSTLSTLAESTDLIASAEPLMQTSTEVYEIATVDDASEHNTQDNESLNTLNASEEDAISILKISSPGMTTEDLLHLLKDDPRVLMLEPNYLYYVEPLSETAVSTQSSLAADTLKDLTMYQWAMENNNETLAAESNSPDYDVNAPSWNTLGTTNAVGSVAVVDTGIDYTHPDLVGVMHNNMRDYVDYGGDYGFNSAMPDMASDPRDDNGHGTHCAGIIASEWNSFGTSGVASGVKVVAVRASNENHFLSTASTVLAYEYLADAINGGLKLKAINDSWGGEASSQIFGLAVTKLGTLGAISVVASGNDTANVDQTANSSAALWSNPYAVIVNSSTLSGNPSYYSNYGLSTTNLFAPGSKILSTVPSTESAYLPEVLDGTAHSAENITFESFTGTGPYQFAAYNSEDLTTPVGAQSTKSCYFDADESSWCIEAASLTNSDGNLAATIEIPVSTPETARYLSMRYHLTGSQTTSKVYYLVKLEGGNGARMSATAPKNEWNTFAFDLQEIEDVIGIPVDFSNDTLTAQIVVVNDETLTGNETLYIDAVGIGTQNAPVPYDYYSGTSMAAPAATGAAMVLAASDTAGISPGEQALERAARLAGSVREMQEFESLCSSGGSLDLTYAQAGDYTPVINSATVSMQANETLITVDGFFFGNAPGVLTIDGIAVEVRTWSSESITFVCPPALQNGLHTIVVTAQAETPSTGKTGQRIFLLELTKTPSTSGTPLFERSYTLPAEMAERDTLVTMKMQALGGFVYTFPGNDYEDETFSSLWRLDPVSGEWTQCSSIPLELFNLSVTSQGENLIVTGYSASNGQCVYSYNPASNSWQELSQDILPAYTTIVNVNEQLILLGGIDFSAKAVVNSICTYDPQSGDVTPIGTLTEASYEHSATVQGNAIVLVSSVKRPTGFVANLITLSSEAGTTEASVQDISHELPTFSPERSNYFAVTAFGGSFALVGSSASIANDAFEDADVYLLDYAEEELEGLSTQSQTLTTQGSIMGCTAFDKRASYAPLYYVNATSTQETLFVFGGSTFETDGYVLRAFGVKNPVDPIKPEPHIPQTGDSPAGVIAVSLCVLGILALIFARTTRKPCLRIN